MGFRHSNKNLFVYLFLTNPFLIYSLTILAQKINSFGIHRFHLNSFILFFYSLLKLAVGYIPWKYISYYYCYNYTYSRPAQHCFCISLWSYPVTHENIFVYLYRTFTHSFVWTSPLSLFPIKVEMCLHQSLFVMISLTMFANVLVPAIGRSFCLAFDRFIRKPQMLPAYRSCPSYRVLCLYSLEVPILGKFSFVS